MSKSITYKNLHSEYHALMANGAILPDWTDERALEMLTYKLNRLGSTFLEEAEFINDVIQWQDFLPYIFSDEEVCETDETGFVSRTIDKDACEKQLRKFIGQIKNPTLSLELLYYFASDSFIDNVLNRGYIIYRGCGDYIKGLCAKLMGEINRSHHTQTIDDLANLGSDYGSSIPDSAKKQKLPLKTITYIDGAPHVMEIYEVGNSKTPQNMQNRKTATPSMNTTFTKPTADFNQYRYAAIRDFLHNTYHFNEFASIKLVRWGDCILKSFYLGNYHNDFEEFLTSTCKALQIDMDCCLNSSEILWAHWVVYIAWMLSRINGNKIAEEKEFEKQLEKYCDASFAVSVHRMVKEGPGEHMIVVMDIMADEADHGGYTSPERAAYLAIHGVEVVHTKKTNTPDKAKTHCDFQFVIREYPLDDAYRSSWLWQDQSKYISINWQDLQTILAILPAADYQKPRIWLRDYLKNHSEVRINDWQEIFREVRALIMDYVEDYFRLNKESILYGHDYDWFAEASIADVEAWLNISYWEHAFHNYAVPAFEIPTETQTSATAPSFTSSIPSSDTAGNQSIDSSFLWPSYTAKASDDDKRTFEDYLSKLCRSTKKSMTKDIKNYLAAKVGEKIISRPEQINTEYEWVKRFGYPRAQKTYYNS